MKIEISKSSIIKEQTHRFKKGDYVEYNGKYGKKKGTIKKLDFQGTRTLAEHAPKYPIYKMDNKDVIDDYKVIGIAAKDEIDDSDWR